MFESRIKLLAVVLSLMLVAVGVWLGGKERWRIQEIASRSDLSTGEVSEVEQSLRDQSDDVISRYNLAILSYQQEEYDQADEIFSAILNSNEGDDKVIRNTLYNLGNIWFKKSEQEEKTEAQLDSLMRSLSYFRAVLEREKQLAKYSNLEVVKDEDAHFNYVLVRKKIKLLQDKLAQQKKEQEREKQLYQLVRELRDDEAAIATELEAMKAEPFSKEAMEKRELLLKKRAENLSKLQVIKEKLFQLVKPQTAQPPAPNII